LILLGVNIDHVATLRNARGVLYPSLTTAAGIAELNGADFITVHLREDRRHINEKDLYLLKESVTTYLNLEMACNEDVLHHAIKAKPFKATLVPERREEVTTEGGLDVKRNLNIISNFVKRLQDNGTKVSLFIEPDENNLEYIVKTGAEEIEIHTGKYANSADPEKLNILNQINSYAQKAAGLNLKVCAGHGLTYHNVKPICKINNIVELNIGHSIISQALFTGLADAVKLMKKIINED